MEKICPKCNSKNTIPIYIHGLPQLMVRRQKKEISFLVVVWYQQVRQVEKGGVTSRRIRAMCFNGQISGAAKLGRK